MVTELEAETDTGGVQGRGLSMIFNDFLPVDGLHFLKAPVADHKTQSETSSTK